MTLVVTDVSRHGIVMVGDSAVTVVDATGKPQNTIPGAAKVHYSPELNLGITVWGYGRVGGTPVDEWICDTLTSLDTTRENLESIGEWIVRELNTIRYQEGRTGEPRTWGGFHLAGYLGGVPRLWHIHNGHIGKPVREFRLHRDYPEDQGWSDEEFLQGLERGWWVHLRNGYIRAFVRQYNSMRGSSGRSWETSDTRLAGDNLASRMNFYKMVVRRVADALLKDGIHPGVNNELSAVAFTEMGPMVDELLPVRSGKLEWPIGHVLGF